MKKINAVLILAVSVLAARAPVAALDSTGPCTRNATLNFDDTPKPSPAHPRNPDKQAAGMNPLQTKQIMIDATREMITVLVRTHDSFQNYWDYAQRRDTHKITAGTSRSGQPLRGELTRFVA